MRVCLRLKPLPVPLCPCAAAHVCVCCAARARQGWLKDGKLTGERPKRMRRRKRMPDGSLPRPGEGYEVGARAD